MNKALIIILTWTYFSANCYATPMYSDMVPRFEKKVLSKDLIAKCDAQKGDERGPFGVIYKEGKITQLFLVMTGVYYDTCKNLERTINRLKRQHSKLILIGTEDSPSKEPNEIIWRWRAIRSISGKECVSYFGNDCE